jgi:hypothetical protein
MEEEYRYDVAISFLAEDEALANQLADLLRDRLSVFVYSRAQEKIAGADGEIEFNKVFESEARTVVVLYRDGWGKTPWTRVEETAIRNRAFKEGYEFVTFIPLQAPPQFPQWLPRTRIWVNLDRWGIKGAAAVIEGRAEGAGATPHDETAMGTARRIEREKASERDRLNLLHSDKGVSAARKELQTLFSSLASIIKQINAPEDGEAGPREIEIVEVQRTDTTRYLNLGEMNLSIAWSQQWGNSLKHSRLAVQLWKGAQHPSGRFGKLLKDIAFHFDVTATGQFGWREVSEKERFCPSVELADVCIKLLIEVAYGKQSPE